VVQLLKLSVHSFMRSRNIIIIVVVCFATILIGVLGTVWLLYSFATRQIAGYEPPQTPGQLKEARVVIGKDFLARSVFVETGSLNPTKHVGEIGDLAVGEFDSHPDLDVVVAGSNGALILDRNGARQSEAFFQFPTRNEKLGPFTTPVTDTILGNLQVVDIEGDGKSEYLARGSVDGAAVFDHEGKLLWTYGGPTKEKVALNDLTVGDLDGDGVAEFVVSWYGIEVFDRSGKRRSQLVEEFGDTQLEVVDTNGDGKNEIISVGAALKIRDSTGRVIKEIEIPGYFGNFALCTMPGQKQPVILSVEDSKLVLIDFSGATVLEFNAPLSEFNDTTSKMPDGEVFHGTSVYKSKGVWIKLAKDLPEYLAVINEFGSIDRSVLDVFTSSGELVYQEVLPEDSLSIAVLPAADPSGVPELLVGGSQTVWRYRIK
jgi:hypothetical protein